MVKQTINLFIKATIIGILINIGIAQVPSQPVIADGHTITIHDETALFQPSNNAP